MFIQDVFDCSWRVLKSGKHFRSPDATYEAWRRVGTESKDWVRTMGKNGTCDFRKPADNPSPWGCAWSPRRGRSRPLEPSSGRNPQAPGDGAPGAAPGATLFKFLVRNLLKD